MSASKEYGTRAMTDMLLSLSPTVHPTLCQASALQLKRTVTRGLVGIVTEADLEAAFQWLRLRLML